MNVDAAAESRRVAMPSRRWDNETKRRGIPSGVGRGVGMRVTEDESETLDDSRVFPGPSSVSSAVSVADRGAMAIAVDILCAMTQPMIFSLCVDDDADSEESRNR